MNIINVIKKNYLNFFIIHLFRTTTTKAAAFAVLMGMALVAALILLPVLWVAAMGAGMGVEVGVEGLAIRRVLFDHDQESQIATYLMSVSPVISKTN